MKKSIMKKWVKRIIGMTCMMVMVFNTFVPLIPVRASAFDGELIEASDVPLRLYYDEEAPYGNENAETSENSNADDGWERWSIPLGNGYFGANVFGRTETERIQLTDKTLNNPYYKSHDGKQVSLGGLNNFSETYIDFGHINTDVTNYSRYLDLNTAISGVSYDYNGVTYTREYFTSYPDKTMVIRLDASEDGALDFTLRPTIPWEQEYSVWEGDGASKEGTVVASVEGNVGCVHLSGTMGYYGIDFVGLYRVVTDGTGTVTYANGTNDDGEVDNGTITVSGAKSAYVYLTLGTDYELSSEVFTASDSQKPTHTTTMEDAYNKVNGYLTAVSDQLSGKSFEEGYSILKSNHLTDYQELFGRVSLNLGDLSDAELTTDELLAKYQSGEYSTYLEALYFQYGRYLLIASSRAGALPANLQGTWNQYNYSPWASGLWHNINEQMNYWPAFNTNLAETFEAYVEYNAAYMEKAEELANAGIQTSWPEKDGEDGGNGWCIGTSAFPNNITAGGAGNLGFTTQLFWEYYLHTQDKELLEEVVFPVLLSAARYIVKTVKLDENGYYLARGDSPEQNVDGARYNTWGAAYGQSFIYLNNYNTLLAAKELGIDLTDSELLATEEYSVLATVLEQIDKYDPINVGFSGQVKEFREEEYYGEIGQYTHRHISQLVGLYPGNIITSNTQAWLDAAMVTLTERGDNATGWGVAHRLNLWARTKRGDRTYELLNILLSANTATNLWDLHPPFQIDGNLGGTAGIAEMLLQSHEGYIEPLAALPSAWASGSYTGLVARGNFEVSAAWENGLATSFNIKSQSGGTAIVKYDGITSSQVVRASDGKIISYDITGDNVISFETEAGETYIIRNFATVIRPEAVASVSAEREALGPITLSWDAVDSAVSYRVYVAIDSAPEYTFIARTSDTSFVYTPRYENTNARFTFRVTAVNALGNESDGTLCYLNPLDISAELISYEANAFDNGELQIIIKASENTKSYKLWKKAATEEAYSLIDESIYPIMICSGYSAEDSYAISLVSENAREETELYVIEKIQAETAKEEESIPEWEDNILLGSTPSSYNTTALSGSQYTIEKLTDGSFDNTLGRFALKSVANSYAIVEYDLGALYELDAVKIYDFVKDNETVSRTNEASVEVYVNGEWQTLIDAQPLADPADRLSNSNKKKYTQFSLDGAKTSKIRFTFRNTLSTLGVTLYEIELRGCKRGEAAVIDDNILSEALFTGDRATIGGYGYEKLTDGSFELHAGRFAIPNSNNSIVTLETNLECVYELYELKIYGFDDNGITRSNETTVEVYYCGEWITLIDKQPLASGSDRLKDSNGQYYTKFSLRGAKGEKLRITCHNNGGTKGITIYEIECSGSVSDEGADTNILSSVLSVNQSGASVNSSYPLTNAFDGDKATRYEVTGASSYVLEMDLGGAYTLYNMNVYDYRAASDTISGALATRSDDTYVELYIDGAWVRVIDNQALSVSEAYTSFNLDGYVASKIRIGFNNTRSFDGGDSPAASIYEITCSIRLALADRKPLLNAYSNLAIISNGTDEYNSNMERFFGYLTSHKLTIEKVSAYSAEINAFGATLLNGEHSAHDIEAVEAKAPDCESYGWFAYEYCNLCDYTTYEEVPAFGHQAAFDWSYGDGKHWYACENGCGERFDEASCSGSAATCTDPAICEVCQSEYESALGHLYDDDCDSTCNRVGCDYTRTATDHHDFNAWTKVDDESHTSTCRACGIPVTEAHEWDEGAVTKQPTHTETGIKIYTCEDCGASKTEVVEKITDHSFENWTKVDDENHTGTCVCGASETVAHDWNLGVITEQPTHTAVGEKTYTCEDCGATKSEVVEKIAEHSFGTWMQLDGENHTRGCACGELEIKAHEYGEWTVTKEATATEAGSKTKSCVCGHTVTEAIPATGNAPGGDDGTANNGEPDPDEGLSGGAVVAIAAGATATVVVGGFSLFWFVIKKRR